jgi:iron complex transport system permease protein
VLIGFALSVAGACYQGVFQNPLVSPDMLGVSAGATVGAAISILLGLGFYLIMALAFLGGVGAVALCVLIPTLARKKSTLALVLSGIIVGGFLNSVLGLIKYLADTYTQLPEIVFWQLGSLSRVNQSPLFLAALVIVTCCIFLILMRWRLNALSLSDREAQSLGVNVVRERSVIIVLATIVTAVSVCISGTIGWIGLTMPHFARLIVGDDNAKVIPLAGVMGAIFLVVVDFVSRNLTGAEIPLGIITGFLGAPLFAVLLIRQRKVD